MRNIGKETEFHLIRIMEFFSHFLDFTFLFFQCCIFFFQKIALLADFFTLGYYFTLFAFEQFICFLKFVSSFLYLVL